MSPTNSRKKRASLRKEISTERKWQQEWKLRSNFHLFAEQCFTTSKKNASSTETRKIGKFSFSKICATRLQGKERAELSPNSHAAQSGDFCCKLILRRAQLRVFIYRLWNGWERCKLFFSEFEREMLNPRQVETWVEGLMILSLLGWALTSSAFLLSTRKAYKSLQKLISSAELGSEL
jgi:hypothetical protein